MFRKHAIIVALAGLCTGYCGGIPQAMAQSANIGISPIAVPQITQTINNNQLSPMATNVPAQANTVNDRGLVSADLPLDHMLLLLHRSAAQEQALQALMKEQQDPNSANYHHWLTPAQFGQYGLAQSDIDTISTWLRDQGFTVNQVYSSRTMIDFSGTAGEVQAAFKTAIHTLNVKGVTHIANMNVPQIPLALAPAVVGIVSLNDFRPHTNYKMRVQPNYTVNSSSQLVVPADLQTIYNITPLLTAIPTPINGAGQTIALIEDTDVYSTQDIATFRSTFGLPVANFTQVHPGPSTGPSGCIDPGDVAPNDGEAELDVEWAGASAPGAALQLVSCADTQTTFGGLIAMNNLLLEATPPSIWSVSYGFCEAANGEAANAAYSSTYQQAAAAGISVFVSSGDEGAASCDANQASATHGIAVSGFTSTPYNVSVGGTDFGDSYAGTNSTYWNGTNTATYGSAKSYINEIPWNGSCASQLIANGGSYFHTFWAPFATTYGPAGFCNDPNYGETYFLTTGSGSGGPSGCATGLPSIPSPVVSGSCAGTPKPWWQTGFLGNPNDGVRDIPDVSLFAANGVWGHIYAFCYSYDRACTGGNPSAWSSAGGTSFASPIMAGIQALVNQKIGAKVGNPNPVYYQLAAAEYGATGSTSCNSSNGNSVGAGCIFYDVTQGDMDVNCGQDADPGANNALFNCYMPGGSHGVLSTSASAYQPAYGTTTGWDFATGIGSVNAANLVNNWPVAGNATKLAFSVEPKTSYGANLPITVDVSVEDASGKLVTGNTSAITLALSGGTIGASLGGTSTVNAVSGVATFTLTVNLPGTAYKLTGSDGSLSSATSSAFNITNAAQTLTFSTEPVTAAAGANIPVVVHVADVTNAAVVGDAITLLISTNPGGSTLTGSGPVTTDASGNATFSGVSLNMVGTGYILTATDSSNTPITTTSSAFNITAGPAQTLTFVASQPSASNYTAANPIPVAVVVTDASGNPVAGESVTVAIAYPPASTATLSGTLTATTDATGTATFGNPTPVSLNLVGLYQLGATDTTTTTTSPGLSPQFNITAGPPTQLAFTSEPVTVVQGTTMTTVQVAEKDAQGNVETSDSASNINFTIPACGGPLTLGNITLKQGVATLGSQRYYTVANNLQMTAGNTSLNMPTITSTTFNVTANADLVFSNGFEGCRL